ncbi:hypothetical protein C8R43DRAFT_949021 [Mycena crocata]|nr:hypothetical protein C8R43DRAFT_949021 [Mycena crocata]
MSNAAPATEPNTSSSERKLEVLASLITGMTRMSLAMAQHCMEVQAQLPAALSEAVAAAAAEGVPADAVVPSIVWIEVKARTPDQVDAAHPPGTSDDLTYHVVIAGREPGIYASVVQADYQVHGVPGSQRSKQRGRKASLLYYRYMHGEKHVHKWIPETEIAPAAVDATPAAGPAAAEAPAAQA